MHDPRYQRLVRLGGRSSGGRGLPAIRWPARRSQHRSRRVLFRQSRHRNCYEDWLRRYLPLAEIATVTYATADDYAAIRLELKRSGHPLPSHDVWIAALARQHVLPVLSNDTHFDMVAHLERIAFSPAD
ncbi:MAG: PIN domain-containing protein [Bryobacterales bacterium]|nr:PIN domain-containing protein [Bryobacterales bacterium]